MGDTANPDRDPDGAPASDPGRPADRAPRTETRISLVLYGGVSLAVYISGCCQELLSLVRATADDDAVPDDELTPVERVYRRVARDRGPDGHPQRIVVDVLSGSSAGGLNAIYLAKALTHGGRLDGLRDVWRREADFLRLLNPATAEGARQGSLLNAVHFQKQLRLALEDLSADSDVGPGDRARRLVQSVDCYVTATDLRGVAERVQLDAERDIHIEELQRRAVFHFRDWDEPIRRRHDLAAENDPILAFAGRATAAHPAAFLPAQWDNPDEPSTVADGYSTDLASYVSPRIAPDGKPLNIKGRWYSDGGAMDNKPFKYALEPLADRRADIPVSRKLLYIEPDPDERFESWDSTSRPGLAEYTIATYGLARTENIREDMEALAARNGSIERLNSSLAGLFGRDLARIEQAIWATTYPGKSEAEYRDMPAQELIDAAVLDNYSPYSRVGEVPTGQLGTWMSESDEINAARRGWGAVALEDFRWRTVLTQVIDAVLTVEDHRPDPVVVAFLVDDVRSRVESWIRAKHGSTDGTEVNPRRVGLSLLDGSYRLRRFTLIEHLLGHEQLRINREGGERSGGDRRRFDQCTELRQEINGLYFELRNFLEEERARDVAPHIHGLPKEEILELVRSPEFDDVISTVIGGMEYPLRAASERGRRAIRQAEMDHDLKLRVVDAWVNYPDYDQLILPLADIAQGELDAARALRLSPLDAPSLIDQRRTRRRKLGGNALDHFGGFLDPAWRLSDITWGRLDTAEIVMAGIIDHTGSGEECRAAIREAQLAVLTELAEESVNGATGPGEDGCQLGAILRVNEPGRRTGPLHTRAEASLRALRTGTDGPDGSPVEPEDVARAFLDLLGGSDGEGDWSVDLGPTEARARTKTEIADRAVRIAGRVLAGAGPVPRPGRALGGWVGARVLRLAVPDKPIHRLVRFLLPLGIIAAAVAAAVLSVLVDWRAAVAVTAGVAALGVAFAACLRVYRPDGDARPWFWAALVGTGLAGGLALAGAVIDVGAAATVVVSAQLFGAAALAWFVLSRIRTLIHRLGHPAEDEAGP